MRSSEGWSKWCAHKVVSAGFHRLEELSMLVDCEDCIQQNEGERFHALDQALLAVSCLFAYPGWQWGQEVRGHPARQQYQAASDRKDFAKEGWLFVQ